jgi:uncharacterized protein (UPF0335 family)
MGFLTKRERAELAEDTRGVYAEPSPPAFDATALRQVIHLRGQNKAEQDERQPLVDEYLHAVGDLAGLALDKAAMERAGLMPPV